MCGTSVAQIERTYYHLNDEIRLTNAVANYRVGSDGTIRLVQTVVNRVDTISTIALFMHTERTTFLFCELNARNQLVFLKS